MQLSLRILSPAIGLLLFALPSVVSASCSAPANQIEQENCLPGTPESQWDVFTGAGDSSLQGFATDISVNTGETVNFKISTDAAGYAIEIYRMGYYGGMGARLLTTLQPPAALANNQPACITDSTTGIADCGNWRVSASWQVPPEATSGIYFAHLVRNDTGGDSHIVFIVRSDTSHSDILFQTSDETWQAYNDYAGSSFYGPSGAFDLTNRGSKVSYNRPFRTRGFADESATWVFGAEYPMVRWLEANGYDVTYFTGVDAARSGDLIKNHKLYMTVGHDEYWSGPHRDHVEAARDAGVNIAFFSGNEVFWKTRWENSIDGTNTPYRTLVCYKETLAGHVLDPLDPSLWTGTWRDTRFSPPADGGRPENSLTGTLFMVNGPGTDNNGTLAIQVPAADGRMRFWRNTSVASLPAGQVATLPKGTLGYEWDEDVDNGSRPPGEFELSTATYPLINDLLLDQGGTYGAGSATHHLTFYRASSGALVFGAGTVQWSWGLDSHHDNPFFSPNAAPSPAMQQATVNLFADMGVQPVTLRPGLVRTTASTDTIAPSSAITWPSDGAILTSGSNITVTGTAVDSGGGVIGGIEVSVDGGSTWHPAKGRENWTYGWTPSRLGSFNIQSRATDDSGNIEAPSASASVITVAPPDCPCSDWSASTAPSQTDGGDGTPGEYGVRFRSDFDGYITGLRFYKSSANTGTHIGNLWSNSGDLLATATFSAESGFGWQQVNFNNPLAITANTTYVASYFAPNGHYSAAPRYFLNSGHDAPPLHLLASGVDGSNGVFSYGSSSTFPSASFNGTNYWVDVIYVPASSMPGAPPALLTRPTTLRFDAFTGQGNPESQTINVYNEGEGSATWTASADQPWITVSSSSGNAPSALTVSVNAAGLAPGNYTGNITISSPEAANPPQVVSVFLSVSNLLLSSNFSNGSMSGWAFSPLGGASNWSVNANILQYNGGGHTQVYAGNSAWADYTLKVAVKVGSLADYPGGIRGHVDPATGSGYAVWLYPAEGLVKLFRNVAWNIDQGFVVLGQGKATFDSVNFHAVQLSFQGSQIQVSYDGNPVITAIDGTYPSGAIALDVSNQPVSFTNVMVTSPVGNSGALTASADSFTFSAQYQSDPAPQQVQLANASSGALIWSATSDSSWLRVSPAFGSTPTPLSVIVNSSSLAPGTYNGTVTVVSLGSMNPTKQIPVSLSVTTPAPLMVLSSSSMNFVASLGQPSLAQSLTISNGAAFGSFGWKVTSDSPWLSATSSFGLTPQTVQVTVNSQGLAAGTYSGILSVTADGVSNSPQSLPVTLQVLSPDMNETFSDSALGWTHSPMGNSEGWSVSQGIYSYSGLGLSQSCTGNSSWSDYTFDTNIQLSTLSNWPGGVRGRVNPLTGAGYAVWVYPSNGRAILYSVPQWDINGPGVLQLAQSALSLDRGVHDLQMDFRGSVISVSWDGSQIMTAQDSQFSKGAVCLDADSQPISYSSIRVAAVESPVMLDQVTPANLTFSVNPGSVPAPVTINVGAGSASTIWAASSNVPWLTLSASNNLTPGSLTISADASGLDQGSYPGVITISAPGASNSPVRIPVTLSVKSAVLSLSSSGLTFFGTLGTNPVPQVLRIANSGTGSLNWTAGATSSWLQISPTAGIAPSSLTVTPDTTTSGMGTFTDTITVASDGAGNSPAAIPVEMHVGSLLLKDTFASGSAGNWTISPLGFAGDWSVVNGSYIYDGAGHTQTFAGSSTWTNYTVAADFQLSSVNDYPGGLRGRVNTLTGASYGVWIYPAERTLKLFRIGQWNIDADASLLAESAQLNIDTSWHNVRLVFQGANIQIYYDDMRVITANDSTYSQGAIALDVSNQPIAFDNVTVISLP